MRVDVQARGDAEAERRRARLAPGHGHLLRKEICDGLRLEQRAILVCREANQGKQPKTAVRSPGHCARIFLAPRRPSVRHRPPGLRPQARDRPARRFRRSLDQTALSRATRPAPSPNTTGSRTPTPRRRWLRLRDREGVPGERRGRDPPGRRPRR